MHKNNPEVVYNKRERTQMLAQMQQASDQFYANAVATRCHAIVEFTGLMNEFIVACREASEAGLDFTQANRHSGQALPMKEHNAAYLGEKIGCIYGPSFEDPKVFEAFVSALGLPFKVKIETEPTQKVARFEELLED